MIAPRASDTSGSCQTRCHSVRPVRERLTPTRSAAATMATIMAANSRIDQLPNQVQA